jgi:hypothetical protein
MEKGEGRITEEEYGGFSVILHLISPLGRIVRLSLQE